MLDRLTLSEKVTQMADGAEQAATLPDPAGEISELRFRHRAGIQVGKMRVPPGATGIIYDWRVQRGRRRCSSVPQIRQCRHPRGGSEASGNRVIAGLVQDGLPRPVCSAHAVASVDTTDRAAVGYLITGAGVLST